MQNPNSLDNLPSLQEYLTQSGVLGRSEEEINAAKKEYRNLYKRLHKRKKRQVERKIEVWLTEEEWGRFKSAAGEYQLSMVKIIKRLGLAYLDQKYVVPNRKQVAHIELLLSRLFDEMERLGTSHGNHRVQVMNMQRSLQEIEGVVSLSLRGPQLLEETIRKEVADPASRLKLLSIIQS